MVRALIYGSIGWAVDRAFTTVTRTARTGRFDPPRADLTLVPIYALALPLFEPIHEALRRSSHLSRAVIYGLGFIAAEYTIGRALQRAFGRAPWHYAASRWSVHGYTRLDYAPLWAIAGLVLERIHDLSTRRA